MRQKHARCSDVTPAQVTGADAEIVFFTIALRKNILAKQARIVEAVALYVHANPTAVGMSTTHPAFAVCANASSRIVSANPGIAFALATLG